MNLSQNDLCGQEDRLVYTMAHSVEESGHNFNLAPPLRIKMKYNIIFTIFLSSGGYGTILLDGQDPIKQLRTLAIFLVGQKEA